MHRRKRAVVLIGVLALALTTGSFSPGVLASQSAGTATPQASPQATPAATSLPESDALWAGNYVDQLPSCDGEGVCLATMSNSARNDEYYHGIVQNNTAEWVQVNDVSVTLFDTSGALAAQGDSYDVSPRFVSPGGHALVGVTVAGEYVTEFTAEASIAFEPMTGTNIYFYPLQVDNAAVRGTGVLGEVTNASPHSFNSMTGNVACFGADGKITYVGGDSFYTGPYLPGTTVAYSLPIYNHDCTNFAVVITGSP